MKSFTHDHGDEALELLSLLRVLLNELLPGLVGHIIGVEPGALRPLHLHGEGLVVVLPVPGSPHHVVQNKLSIGQIT